MSDDDRARAEREARKARILNNQKSRLDRIVSSLSAPSDLSDDSLSFVHNSGNTLDAHALSMSLSDSIDSSTREPTPTVPRATIVEANVASSCIDSPRQLHSSFVKTEMKSPPVSSQQSMHVMSDRSIPNNANVLLLRYASVTLSWLFYFILKNLTVVSRDFFDAHPGSVWYFLLSSVLTIKMLSLALSKHGITKSAILAHFKLVHLWFELLLILFVGILLLGIGEALELTIL